MDSIKLPIMLGAADIIESLKVIFEILAYG